jgi:hypothetical protein
VAFVLKHCLRASAGTSSSFKPEGWHPKLQLTLVGESPAGAELVWTVLKPDGSDWFEHRVDAPELEAGEMTTIDLHRWEDGTDIDEAGDAGFSVRLVSELDGVDETLHEGVLRAVALEGEHRYAVDFDWLLPIALVCLDTVDESDAPKLKVTAFLKGEVDSYQVEAHCFYNGKRFAQASSVDGGYGFTANDGAGIGQEFTAEFETVRGWNNLADEGWGGEDWHLLDANDGDYEVKFVREKKVARVVAFRVENGQVVPPGAIEFDRWTGTVLITPASIEGDKDGPWDADSPGFYGDPVNGFLPGTIEAVYEERQVPEAAEEPLFDEDTTEALQRYSDRAERLLHTWSSIEDDSAPFSNDQLLQYEVLRDEMPAFREMRAAASDVPDDHEIQIVGETTTVGDAYARVLHLGELAEQRIAGAQDDAEAKLAPYRAVLANDKLAVFEDHPATGFRYYTTNKKVIETPEELAAAEFWYFEGSNETKGRGEIDGVKVDVTVEGWRVLGWKFDADGNTVAEYEEQGQGGSAPKTAFQHE